MCGKDVMAWMMKGSLARWGSTWISKGLLGNQNHGAKGGFALTLPPLLNHVVSLFITHTLAHPSQEANPCRKA